MLPVILVVAVGGAAFARESSVERAIRLPRSRASRRISRRPCCPPRRVVDELAQPVGEARLAAALQPIAASLTDSSCLRVTVDGEQIVDVHGDTPLIPASTLKLVDYERRAGRARRRPQVHDHGAGRGRAGRRRRQRRRVARGRRRSSTHDARLPRSVPSSARSGDAPRVARRQHRRRGCHADPRGGSSATSRATTRSATCLRGRSATSARRRSVR